MKCANIIRDKCLYSYMEIDPTELPEYFDLRDDPEYISDLGTVSRAMLLLNRLEEITGEEYAFYHVQQRTIGGHCSVLPKNYEFKENPSVILLGRYGKEFFIELEKRLSI